MDNERQFEGGKLVLFTRSGIWQARIAIGGRRYLWRTLKTSNEGEAKRAAFKLFHLSTLVPTAPGYVGSYQAAFVVILGQFGVTATSALVAATAVQVYLIGSFTLLGLAIMAIAALMAMARPAKPPES